MKIGIKFWFQAHDINDMFDWMKCNKKGIKVKMKMKRNIINVHYIIMFGIIKIGICILFHFYVGMAKYCNIGKKKVVNYDHILVTKYNKIYI